MKKISPSAGLLKVKWIKIIPVLGLSVSRRFVGDHKKIKIC